ncbi:hypothetical protein QGX12_gp003 [Pseudomonas phage Kremar]|uniref:Uncharacterized protein n=1 Tax=Pseudomonas phage Kremar TaxID=2928831 RepID=A0AAE9KFK7_9CAUD|nr:hypothetical protein QGX12_gp003 [Pseudomonas phage Kremar]UOL48426.1 hypothetical protein [Pseudomonas phage Kremar]
MGLWRDYNGDLHDDSKETMTDWEYMERREHIENIRHWEGDECADAMMRSLNREYDN